jgi:hypothetical protein
MVFNFNMYEITRLENFSNIRKCKSLQMSWFGAEAKFIVVNLYSMIPVIRS